ncbi:hypothetical protein SeLEV6574_g07220 [Synchytrium endobioticum]|uniref:Uncharacterized protein n=1 Tax=Synchytrium endobioticum TaxID=286115 RepID=A0A507CD24_9FUNG|nr:hypothetical protein SeLEV6574_g07220 [Synchytrium endobioticum]
MNLISTRKQIIIVVNVEFQPLCVELFMLSVVIRESIEVSSIQWGPCRLAMIYHFIWLVHHFLTMLVGVVQLFQIIRCLWINISSLLEGPECSQIISRTRPLLPSWTNHLTRMKHSSRGPTFSRTSWIPIRHYCPGYAMVLEHIFEVQSACLLTCGQSTRYEVRHLTPTIHNGIGSGCNSSAVAALLGRFRWHTAQDRMYLLMVLYIRDQ